MSARTIIWYLPCWVRVDIWWWYELTSLSGTSWHGYELTWVRVDIYCVGIDVNSYHHLILALLGTSWHHLWYELTSLVVRVDIWWWYELTWVRVDMGTSWHGYKMTWVRVDRYSSVTYASRSRIVWKYPGIVLYLSSQHNRWIYISYFVLCMRLLFLQSH